MPIMEHDIPADTRDNDFHGPESNDAEIGIAHNLTNSRRNSKNSLDQAEHCYPSAYHASTTGKRMTAPFPNEEPFPAPPPPLRQSSEHAGRSTNWYAYILKYHTCPRNSFQVILQGIRRVHPFEEAGPTSSVWRAYLDESLIDDTDILEKQRGEVNILLVFVSSFSQIRVTFLNCILFCRRDYSPQLSAPSLHNHGIPCSQTIRKCLLYCCLTRSIFNAR